MSTSLSSAIGRAGRAAAQMPGACDRCLRRQPAIALGLGGPDLRTVRGADSRNHCRQPAVAGRSHPGDLVAPSSSARRSCASSRSRAARARAARWNEQRQAHFSKAALNDLQRLPLWFDSANCARGQSLLEFVTVQRSDQHQDILDPIRRPAAPRGHTMDASSALGVDLPSRHEWTRPICQASAHRGKALDDAPRSLGVLTGDGLYRRLATAAGHPELAARHRHRAVIAPRRGRRGLPRTRRQATHCASGGVLNGARTGRGVPTPSATGRRSSPPWRRSAPALRTAGSIG